LAKMFITTMARLEPPRNGLTATPYDAYNWRYRQNEMLIWKLVSGKYLRNQKRYDQGWQKCSSRHDTRRTI